MGYRHLRESARRLAWLGGLILLGIASGCAGNTADTCPSGSSTFTLTDGAGAVEQWCKTAAGVAHGPYTKRTATGGPLLAQGDFADGEAQGPWTEWTKVVDAKGTRLVKTLEAHYAHGLRHGLFRSFAIPSGKLAWEATYEGGVACGTRKVFDDSGKITSQTQFTACDKVGATVPVPTDPLLAAPKTQDFGWDGKSCPGGAMVATAAGDSLERYCTVDGVRQGDYGRFIVAPGGERKIDAGQYAAGKRTGLWRNWHANSVLAATGSYVNDLRSGEWRLYLADGWLAESASYASGLRHGVARSYHDGGVLGAEMTWSHGALEGPAKSWKADGEPDSVGNYVGNLRHGAWAYFGHDLGGLVRSEGNVVAGYNQGVWKGTYVASGHKESEFAYSDNEINGLFSQWHENGQEATSGRYIANLRNGQWLFHYDNGQLWVSAHYQFGELDGTYEAYYPDGKPKVKGTYGAVWTFWDENGAVTSCGAAEAQAYRVCP